MKMSSLSFADYAAIEALTALIPLSRFFTENPEQDMARVAYKHADALDAQRKRRDGVVDYEREALERRAERAEKSWEILRLAINEILTHDAFESDAARVAAIRTTVGLPS